MLELRDLRMLTTLATHGSLVRAGRVLGISQSALTRALASMEARVGASMFERSRRGLEPTDVCRAVLAHAGEILAQCEALDAAVGELRGGQVEEIGIAAGPFALETIVTTAAARFVGRDRSVRLRLVAVSAIEAVRQLRDRRVDLAIAEISDLNVPEEFSIQPLRRHPILPMVRPGHPLLGLGRRPEAADVFSYPIVATPFITARLGVRLAKARAPLDQMRSPVAFPACITESVSAGLLIAAESDAIAGATAPSVRAFVEAGTLVVLPWHEPWLVTNFGILMLRNRLVKPAARMLVEAFEAMDAEAFARARAVAPEHVDGLPEALAVQGSRAAPAM